MADTLRKFGVPTGDGSGRGGILQPKQKHKYRVRFVNFGPITGGIDMTQQMVSIDRPKLETESVQVDSYTSRAYFAGKHTWSDISVVLRDDVTNSVSRLVGAQEQKTINHFEQTSALAGINYKFTMFIEQMDGGNDAVLEQWVLEGCWLTNVDYDQNDYSTGDTMHITLTVKYDNATQSDGLMPDSVLGLPGVRL